jgi:uncharacterized membrane protein (TIGR02234 family)
MSRRSYPLTLLACLAGAGLAVYAATRTWSLEVVPRPGLSDLRTARTGADVQPWLVGLALVALAGTGALLATHGRVRRGLGALLALAGAGVVIGAITGRAGLDSGSAGLLWPVVCVAGGAVIIAGGVTAARLGHRWPRMSARYDRRPSPPPPETPRAATARPAAADADHRATWDALDRGDDPTDG